MIYPPKLTPLLTMALTMPSGYCHVMAQLYRADGHVILPRPEEERAFVTDRLVRLVCQHGDAAGPFITEEFYSLKRKYPNAK